MAAGALAAPITQGIDKEFGSVENGRVYGAIRISPNGTEFSASGLAGEFLKATTRQAMTILVNRGGRLDWTSVAVDAFGDALGNSIVGRMQWGSEQERRVANASRAPFANLEANLARFGLNAASNGTGTVSPVPLMMASAADVSGTIEGYYPVTGGSFYPGENPFTVSGTPVMSGFPGTRPTPAAHPLDANVVGINGDIYTEREALEWAKALAATPDDPEYAAFMNASREIAHRYGFAAGARGTEEYVRNVSDPAERMRYVTGTDNDPRYTGVLLSSVNEALATDAAILAEREGVFTYGRVTRVMGDGTERTIRIDRTPDVAGYAKTIGVSEAEALAKVDWRVWDKTLDSAFATPGLHSFRVSGAWRQEGAIDPTDTVHYKGRSLDINAVNGIDINYARTTDSTKIDFVKQFSYNLRHTQGVSQVIQPWMTYGVAFSDGRFRRDMDNGFVANLRTDGVEWDHRHHLHVSYGW